jgi:hypothetical protein
MLFQAGRASGLAESRGRFAMFAAAASVVVVGLGMFSFAERSRRHALEIALTEIRKDEPAGEPRPERRLGRSLPPPRSSSVAGPISIASNDPSPYNYRALSLLENPGEFVESVAMTGALKSARAPSGADSRQAPLRVRDSGKLLEF